jgi:hypothetical protein
MPGHIEMQDTPPVMSDDKKAVEYAEGQRWQCEEIHCSNRFTMVIQKSSPSLHRFGTSRLSSSTEIRALRDFLRERCDDAYQLEGRIPDP